jgi:ArsR family transcriptional regulator
MTICAQVGTNIIFKKSNVLYNIFNFMNINQVPTEEKLSRIFRAIGTPIRLQILAAIGYGEACVCHLEAVLDLRQAYISQQLMELREASLLETRREGRYIYYRLAEPRLLETIQEIGNLFSLRVESQDSSFYIGTQNRDPIPHCCCPKCEDAKQLK